MLGEKSSPGFRVAKRQDQGLELKSLDTAGEQIRPVCERRWLLELSPATDEPASQFVFPKAADAATAMTYQRYSDADIVDAAAVVPLHGSPVFARHWVAPLGGVGVAVLAGTLGLIGYRRVRRRRLVPGPRPKLSLPRPSDPLHAAGVVRRIHGDEALPVADGDRHALGETIAGLERQFFHRSPEPAAEPDLTAIANRWLAAAADGRKQKRRAAAVAK